MYPCSKSVEKAVGSVKFSIEIMWEIMFLGAVHRYTRLKISHMGRVYRCTSCTRFTSH